MGTRSIVMVRLNDEIKVARYNQFDGYPTGAGGEIAAFIAAHLMAPESADAFAKKVAKLKFGSDKQLANKEFSPGPAILADIAAGKIKANVMPNDIEFLSDGLFCEYGYLIDLTTQVVDVFRWGNNLVETIPFAKFTVAEMISLQARLNR